MFRSLRPIRPVRVVRPPGAPLVRGLVVGGAVCAAARRTVPATAVTDPVTDLTTVVVRLGELAQRGLLTPEEFAAAKARLLSS